MKLATHSVVVAAALSVGAGCSGSVETTPEKAEVMSSAGGENDQSTPPQAQAGIGGGAGGRETPTAGGAPAAGAAPGASAGGPAVACFAVMRYTTATIRADYP